MRNLLALCLAFPLMTGCLIVSSSGDPPAGFFDAIWVPVSQNHNKEVWECPPGAVTAQLVSYNVDTGEEFLDCAPCGDFELLTAPLPLGDYDVHLNITGATSCAASEPLIAQSEELFEPLVDFDGKIVELDFTLVVADGAFRAGWILEDDLGPGNCDEFEQYGVGILSTWVADNSAWDDLFDCEGDGTCGAQCATTPSLPAGDYDVVVDVLDQQEGSLVPCYHEDTDEWVVEEYLGVDELVDLGDFICDYDL